MQAVNIILEKILLIGVLIAVGYLAGKVGIIDRDSNKKLSELLLLVVAPCVILQSYQTDYSPELLKNLLIALGLSALCFLMQTVIALVCIGRERADTGVERMSVVFSNCMFLGIPLVEALYGAEGVLYLTAYITMFNTLAWTEGVLIMTNGEGDRQRTGLLGVLKKLCSPALIAIALGLLLYVLRIQLPGPILDPLRMIGNMNTPLAMFIAGASIAKTDLKACVMQPRIYRVTLLRMLVAPLLVLAMLYLMPVARTIRLALFLAAACPAASYCTMFAYRYGKNSVYAAEIFAFTTLLSLAQLPLAVLLGEWLL